MTAGTTTEVITETPTTAAAVSGNATEIQPELGAIKEEEIVPEYKHLVVFVHGLFAFPRVWNYSSKLLKEKMGPSALMFISTVNHQVFNGTNDGADQAGTRLAKEVLEVVSKHKKLEEISFVGMSMGGLISRYAIGVLYREEDGTIAGLKPYAYASFASPHLGARGQVSRVIEHGLSHLPYFKGSCDQFFMRDIQSESGVPLLVEMTMPEYKFYKGFALFKKRVLYSNVMNDHRTAFQSGAMWPYHLQSPYNFHSDYETLVIHDDELVSERTPELEPFYKPDSHEWNAAHNFSDLKIIRYGAHLNGWFSTWLNHSNIIVAFETINSIGKNVIAHFVDSFDDVNY